MKPAGIRRMFRFPSRAATDVGKDVRDELAFHIDMRTKDLVAGGLTPDEARARALEEFGDLTGSTRSLTRHDGRLERSRLLARVVSDVRQDLSYGLRLLSRSRGFTVTAVLTLAVAIGGNTTMFSVVNALFFMPLPVRAPHEIARIYTGESTVSWPNIEDIRRRNTVFTDVVAQGHAQVSLSGEPLPLRLSAGLVSMNYFAVLGSAPIAGRTLQPNDIPADVAILSENLWRTRFGGSPSIIGQPIAIDGRRREVIGVMPRSFRGIGPPGFTREIWIPLDLTGAHRGLAINRTATRFEAYGRLEPGTSMDAARAAMRVVGIHMAAEHPVANRRFTAMEIFAVEGIGVYRGVAKTLLPVFAFVGFVTLISGFVLLVSCANLAGLLLARGGARRQEIAVCLALGAGRGRLMRQLLTESLLLAFAGGLAGLALATALTSGLSRLTGLLPVPVDLNLALDHRVLAYALAVSTATALLFGLAPARRASRVQLVHSLKVDGGGDRARQRLRKALIVAQVSVSALLIFWSGLFARSLLQANSVDPGFDPSGVLLAEVQLQDDAPGAAGRAQHAFVELHNRVRALASVEEAGWSSIVPLALLGNERFRASRTDAPQDVPGLWVVASRLSPGWFPTVRIPFAAGRDFTWLDREGSPMVVIVNETLARQLWNGAAVGQQLRFWSKTAEVVGVVRDSKYSTLGEAPAPTVYLPFPQAPVSQAPTLHVRTSDTRATAERIRQLVQELVPGATAGLKPMQDAVAMAMVPARVGAGVTGAFGLLGALLATMGIYGLISYLVVQRSREMAIRRAIGAPTSHIVRIAVGGVGTLAVAGLIAGLAAGALTAPLLSGLLVNVSPRDPFTLAATALVVLATTAMAGTPPALRATRIEPLTALKAQ